MEKALLLLALLGHAFLWIGLINRLHAIGTRRVIIKSFTMLFFVAMAAIPLEIGRVLVRSPDVLLGSGLSPWAGLSPNWQATPGTMLIQGYLLLCWIVVVATPIRWLCIRLSSRPSIVRFHRSRRLPMPSSVTAPVGSGRHHFFAHLPGNEVLQLELSEWTLESSRLDAALDGLTIAHWSDLHFTGRIGISYFQEAVRICNDLRPDLVAITGDLVDEEDCIDWIPETLGQLKAPHGVYYVLGNHDLRVDTDRLRRTLANCGLIGLGHHASCMNIRGQNVFLLGNELPWISPVEDAEIFATAPDSIAAKETADSHTLNSHAFRIALAHSPDQFRWARTHDVDLLLAGHTHGGQIRIPPLGTIFSPTFGGVRYATGVFYRPPTTLHVSRGISSDLPIRWNCPPELALLTLRTPAAHGSSVSHEL